MTETPTTGGSYIRQKNGSLKRVEGTEEPVLVTDTSAPAVPETEAAHPAEKPANKDA